MKSRNDLRRKSVTTMIENNILCVENEAMDYVILHDYDNEYMKCVKSGSCLSKS